MIEIYSKFYILIRRRTRMLSSDENQRFQDGRTLLTCTYNTSLKPPKIRVANHTRILSQNTKQKHIYQFFSKNHF